MTENTHSQLEIEISISQQRLWLYQSKLLISEFQVSTALNGSGERANSGCTPLGRHKIKIKIGHDCPAGSVFIGRRATTEVYTQSLAEQYPDRDWILSRILWLSGCESKKNRGGELDTLRRYIYIHGCPDSEPMGVARSHGCIRMHNADVIRLFDMVDNGTRVNIIA